MFKIELTQNDLHNLYQFLNRVEVKGIEEVQAFNMILNALNNRQEITPPKKEDKK